MYQHKMYMYSDVDEQLIVGNKNKYTYFFSCEVFFYPLFNTAMFFLPSYTHEGFLNNVLSLSLSSLSGCPYSGIIQSCDHSLL